MLNEQNNLWEFGRCRIDIEKRFLWHEDSPVDLPLKALELLCVLAERRGTVVSKDEIWNSVWENTFVEETNLTHNIYLLRKAFKDLGEPDPIRTVPRRGYRFTSDLQKNGRVVLERRALTRTLIEELPTTAAAEVVKSGTTLNIAAGRRWLSATAAAVLFLGILGLAAWRLNSNVAATGEQRIRSVAVMPFAVLGSDPSSDHEGVGLADILITRLSGIRSLEIRPTSAVLHFTGRDPIESGKALGVDAVLEGTIYRTNDSVRVTTRLVRLNDRSVVWSGQFEKPVKNSVRIQNEIALHVGETLTANLSSGELAALSKNFTENNDAWQAYSLARHHWNKRNWASMVEAQRLFRNAIALDPSFALAYSGLADTLATGYEADEADALIAKALELDPQLAELYASRGFIRIFHNRDWIGAEEALKRSIELNPNYASAHQWYGNLLSIQGRYEEAKEQMKRAIVLNPISPNYLADMGQIHYFAKEYAAAKDYCQKALESDPEFLFAHEYLHDIYLMTGEYEKAVEAELEAQRINGTFTSDTAAKQEMMEAYRDSQRRIFREKGIAAFERNLVPKETPPINGYLAAARLAFLGESERSLSILEKESGQPGFLTVFVKADPVFDPIRTDPRFQSVLKKLDL